MYMRAIQVTIDDELLTRIDADPEAKSDGRSALLRRAVKRYLDEKEAVEIRKAYERAYSMNPPDPDEVGPFMDPVWPDQ